jgi:hypothetical protein
MTQYTCESGTGLPHSTTLARIPGLDFIAIAKSRDLRHCEGELLPWIIL